MKIRWKQENQERNEHSRLSFVESVHWLLKSSHRKTDQHCRPMYARPKTVRSRVSYLMRSHEPLWEDPSCREAPSYKLAYNQILTVCSRSHAKPRNRKNTWHTSSYKPDKRAILYSPGNICKAYCTACHCWAIGQSRLVLYNQAT